MTKSASINVRLDPMVKIDAERIYSQFGITISDAINIFLHKSIQVGGLPFSMTVEHFNRETEDALKEARGIMSGEIKTKSYTSARELFEELDAEDERASI